MSKITNIMAFLSTRIITGCCLCHSFKMVFLMNWDILLLWNRLQQPLYYFLYRSFHTVRRIFAEAVLISFYATFLNKFNH